MSPVANEAATMKPMRRLGRRLGRGGRSGFLAFTVGLVGMVVTMDSIPCAAGVARMQLLCTYGTCRQLRLTL